MYQVVAFTDDGIQVSEFERFELAGKEAEDWREAGARAVLCEVLGVFDPDDGRRFPGDAVLRGVQSGRDFPGSLGW